MSRAPPRYRPPTAPTPVGRGLWGVRMDKQALRQGIAAASIGFGVVAVVAPETLLKTYGAAASPTARGMTRLWGTRDIVLGVLNLQATGDTVDLMLRAGAALNIADSLLGLLAPALDG